MLKILAGASMLALAALPVQAHVANVYDANGQLVGPLVGFEVGDWTQENPSFANTFGPEIGTLAFSGLVIVNLPPYGLHLVKVSRQGIVTEQVSFYFTGFSSTNCSSPGGLDFLPYINSFDLLPHARFDGQTLWAVDTRQGANFGVGSRFDELNGAGTCTALPGNSSAFVAPAHPVTVNFSPPFSVK
jgi:hypothetical protein